MNRTAVIWQQAGLAWAMHAQVLPLVAQATGGWWRHALAIPDQRLRLQALRSLRFKRFHCAGGSVYAAASPALPVLVSTICALQTLVDYLDNLSDRTGANSERNLRTLHLAVIDALTPGASLQEYYACHPRRDDGGYLAQLVRTCQQGLAQLPGYLGALSEACQRMGAAYTTLQVLKHLPVPVREAELRRWLAPISRSFPTAYWWELAAACGSTLGIFALLRAAAEPARQAPVADLADAYFPWIGGLHILLDYYIDQAEDRAGGDLNFVNCYPYPQMAAGRLAEIHDQAALRARELPDAPLHRLVVAGLPGMYLSDAKVAEQRLGPPARRLVLRAGPAGLASYLYWVLRPPGR